MAKTQILVVEDAGIVAVDIEIRLKGLGYAVSAVVPSGEEAIEKAAETRPDLVLMDIKLKGEMDGIEAAEQIRARFDIPVVYLTAYADDKTLQRAKVTEPFGYIIKPFEEGELRVAIEMSLYKHRAEKEKEKLQAQLFQAQKMEAIGILVGGVAHHFNNLMMVVIGHSGLLLRSLDEQDPLRESVEAITEAGERVASLTRQLLAFSRRQGLQPMVLDLNSTVADMEELLWPLIGEDIDLVIVPEPELARVKADWAQIDQVIMNLAVNAREAMPQGGKLTIKTENVTLDEDYCRVIPEARPGKFVCLSVEDTGVGMDEEIMQHLFEPFFTTKGVGEGAGLGLAVVYGIVKQHEGWINAYSEPGQGSTFKVYLPASSGKPEKETQIKTANARPL